MRASSRSTGGRAIAEPDDDFVSGTSGEVSGIRATARAVLADGLDTVASAVKLQPWRLPRAARALPRRRVLALAIERTDVPNLLPEAKAELARSRHPVDVATTPAGTRGKFENLNALLDQHSVAGYDWLLALDDDVALPHGFLDTFLFLAERFELQLAQPAHRHRSHAAWSLTRRWRGAVARETPFVEIGPVFALRSPTFPTLLPFPPLRFGWGLDLHWSALAREHGWRSGVIDATPVRHGMRRIAAAYDRSAALAEARGFLASHAYVPAADVQRTYVTHRSW